jgi:NADH-quinone oxidoreductase subunit J
MIESLFFYAFSAVLILSAMMVISARNPVHAVLFLILAFFNAAGLFVMLGAEFIAMTLVIVYVGAVAVLFLFVVMMLDINFEELRKGMRHHAVIGGLVGVVLLTELIWFYMSWTTDPAALSRVASPAPDASMITNTHALGHPLYPIRLSLPDRGVDPAGGDDRRDHADAAPAHRHKAAGHFKTGQPQGERRHPDRQSRKRSRGGIIMEIGISHFLVVSAILFTLGVFGIFLNRRNVIIILMSIELMLLSVQINLVTFSAYLQDLTGQVFAMFILTVAAAEAAIGLAILVAFFRNKGTIAVEDISSLKG